MTTNSGKLRPQTTAEAVRAVMREISHIGIDKAFRNKHQNYNFRSVDQVFQTFSPILSSVGLLMIPNVESCDVSEIHPLPSADARAKIQHKATVSVRYDLRLADSDPGDVISATFCGQGIDTSDKAVAQALTSAFKYAVFQIFCVPLAGCVDADADDPERPSEAPPVETLSEQDQAFVDRLESASSVDELKSIGAEIAQAYGVGKSPRAIRAAFKSRRDALK